MLEAGAGCMGLPVGIAEVSWLMPSKPTFNCDMTSVRRNCAGGRSCRTTMRPLGCQWLREATYSRFHSFVRYSASALVTNKCANALRPNCRSNLESEWNRVATYARAIRTIKFIPRRIARMLYPVLCQSMISFDLVVAEMTCARKSVGIDGGFWGQHATNTTTYLHQEDLGVERNLEHAEVDDRYHLEGDSYRRTNNPRELHEQRWRVVQVQKVHPWSLEQAGDWGGICRVSELCSSSYPHIPPCTCPSRSSPAIPHGTSSVATAQCRRAPAPSLSCAAMDVSRRRWHKLR